MLSEIRFLNISCDNINNLRLILNHMYNSNIRGGLCVQLQRCLPCGGGREGERREKTLSHHYEHV